MAETPVAPAIEGWFTEGEAPCLIGTRCRACGTYFFPKQDLFCRNPACRSTDFDEVELSRRGRVWSYTKHYYAPPEPYISGDEFEPYTIAAVELDREKMVILGQVAAGFEPEDLHTGQEMEVVVEKLYQQDGTDYTVWKWKPVEG
jgi:uncharacterized OB-fold protein